VVPRCAEQKQCGYARIVLHTAGAVLSQKLEKTKNNSKTTKSTQFHTQQAKNRNRNTISQVKVTNKEKINSPVESPFCHME